MTKLEKIELEAQKAREKIAAMQNKLKEIDGQRTEQENLQIVQQVRALKLSRAELYAFISGEALPGTLAEAIDNVNADGVTGADAPVSEPSRSRRGRKRRHEPDNETEPGAETPDSENQYNENHSESEGMNHEE